MHALFLPLFALLCASFAVGFALQAMFLSRLRARHSATWEALGCPKLFGNSMGNSLVLLRFIWRREYRQLSDSKFVRLANFLRVYLAAYVVLFALVVVVFLGGNWVKW